MSTGLGEGSRLLYYSKRRILNKKIFVSPNSSLSLQSHLHRSEHWIVTAGTATVQINEMIADVSEGESVYVPLGAAIDYPTKLLRNCSN